MVEKFNPAGKKEKAKSGKLGKLVRAGAIAAGLFSSERIYGQEKTPPEIEISEDEIKDGIKEQEEALKQKQEEDTLKEQEEFWLNLDTREAVRRFAEYANRDFAEHVLEYHVEKQPIYFLEEAHSLETYIDYKRILERAVEKALNNDSDCTYLLQSSTVDVYKILDNYTQFLERAAQKAIDIFPIQILRYGETLFKHLPRTSAEYFLEKAVDQYMEIFPLELILNGILVKQYLPNADRILREAAEKSIDRSAIEFFTRFLSMSSNEKIFSKETTKSLIIKVIEEDPVFILSIISKKRAQESIYYRAVSEVNSIVLDQLKFIEDDDLLSYKEKEQVAVFIDALIFDKHLTVKELFKITNNTDEALKLGEEIVSRKNYIGKQSLQKYFYQLEQKKYSQLNTTETNGD